VVKSILFPSLQVPPFKGRDLGWGEFSAFFKRRYRIKCGMTYKILLKEDRSKTCLYKDKNFLIFKSLPSRGGI
jgi:hypothetical protein